LSDATVLFFLTILAKDLLLTGMYGRAWVECISCEDDEWDYCECILEVDKK